MNIVRKHTEQQIRTSQTVSIAITKITIVGVQSGPALIGKSSLRDFVAIVFYLKLSVLPKSQPGVCLVCRSSPSAVR